MNIRETTPKSLSNHSSIRRPLSGSAPYGSILETIGDTPVVRLNKIGPEHINLYAKLEAFNPMASVKDRLALGVIEAAERSGALKPGMTVIEATSGNTGIGLAMVCAQKGYPLVIVMAESFSLERRKLMRFLGAKVILTPAAERGTGMLYAAERLAEKHGWFWTRQFQNEANADIHSATTAREIMSDFASAGLDYWVTGAGTGGTLKGVARVLKAESPHTKIIVAEPENSQIMNSDIRQKCHKDGSPARSHPNARAHPIQGWSPDFVPKLSMDAIDTGLVDRFVPVSGTLSLHLTRDLAIREGIFCGISGGATLAAALEVAETAPAGSRILTMIPDTGERYLSTILFDDIAEEMSDEERDIIESIPPMPRKAAPAKEDTAPDFGKEDADFINGVIDSSEEPVVMFGFEWCEFCWSVRKLFDKAGIAFRAIDVDSAEYRKADRGGRLLRALFDRTGRRTVPQIFVGGHFVGGASETLAAFNDRTLHDRLTGIGRPVGTNPVEDALSLLPRWARRPASTHDRSQPGGS